MPKMSFVDVRFTQHDRQGRSQEFAKEEDKWGSGGGAKPTGFRGGAPVGIWARHTPMSPFSYATDHSNANAKKLSISNEIRAVFVGGLGEKGVQPPSRSSQPPSHAS